MDSHLLKLFKTFSLLFFSHDDNNMVLYDYRISCKVSQNEMNILTNPIPSVVSNQVNQRTNGPVKAHLISGSSSSTKHTKPEKYKVKK